MIGAFFVVSFGIVRCRTCRQYPASFSIILLCILNLVRVVEYEICSIARNNKKAKTSRKTKKEIDKKKKTEPSIPSDSNMGGKKEVNMKNK